MTSTNIPLVAVAHGSRDPRSASTIHALTDLLRAARPDLDVRTAFLDLSAPRLGDVLAAVHGDGYRNAVVAPLLLGRAFHARVDVPGAVADAEQRNPRLRVHVADVLGPDSRLVGAARNRLLQAGADPADPELGVILAGAGSSHAPANQLVADVAAQWERDTAWIGVSPAFAAAADPDVPSAVRALRARGARRIAVGSWFLAPGLLPDRIATQTHEHVSEPVLAAPMADDPALADLVLHRYDSVVSAVATPRMFSHAQ